MAAVSRASYLLEKRDADPKVRFCHGENNCVIHLFVVMCVCESALLSEKKKEYASALDGYVQCLNDIRESEEVTTSAEATEGGDDSSRKTLSFIKDFRGEIMLRIAVVRKETGNIDQAMQMCNTIALEPCNDSVRANAL